MRQARGFHRHRFYLAVVLLFVLLFNVEALFAQPPVTHKASADLSAYLARTKTFQANFTQFTYDQHGALVQKGRGKVWLKRPGQFRWYTMQPLEEIIIANGKSVWVYNVSLQQATKKTMSFNQHDTPAGLLTGSTSALLKRFVIKRLPNFHDGMVRFQLTPRQAGNNVMSSVILTFYRQMLKTVRVRNKLGQNTVFHFTQVEINHPIAPRLFTFHPPSGVDVLNEQAE